MSTSHSALAWRAPYRRFKPGPEPSAPRALLAGLRDLRDDHVLERVPRWREVEDLRVRHGGWRPLAKKALRRLLERS